MEANLYQDIFYSLEAHTNKLHLNIKYGSPIAKIVLSSFDYMSGPELRFSWIPRYSEPSLLIEEHIDDSSSDKITSSSKHTNDDSQLQYDDFLSSAYECSSEAEKPRIDRMCVSSNGWITNSDADQAPASTLRSSSVDNTTITLNNEIKEQYDINTRGTDDEHSSYTSVSGDEVESSEDQHDTSNEQLKNSTMVTSCVDSGITGMTGTTSMHSNLSNCQSPKPTNSTIQQQPIDELNSCSDHSDYGYCVADETDHLDNGQSATDDSEHLIACVGKHATASFLTTSSNVVGLSMLGASIDYDASTETESKALDQLGADSQKLGDNQTLTDEEFVAKFVLAEQICSIQFNSNPIVPKISIIPNRQLFICSFLFCSKNDVRSMMALSVVMHENAEEWYYSREKTFEDNFIDIITRLKASLLVEEELDFISRVTEDLIEVLNLWGTLERFPLLDNPWKIDLYKTDLMNDYLDKSELRFLYKAITGCLTGSTVVFGNNADLVEKTMMTLCLFIQTSQRMLCVKPHSFHYSPYLKIQGLRRIETEELYTEAGESHYPVCFIDVDRKLVSMSGTYFTQRARKELIHMYSISQIIKEAEESVSSTDDIPVRRPPVVNPISVEADQYVSNCMTSFFLLPAEQNERLNFIQHFQMNLDYKAKALIQTVKELSEPANNFKENFVSSKWSLSTARKLLNLTSDTIFWIVVARADSIINEFAQFLYQTQAKTHR